LKLMLDLSETEQDIAQIVKQDLVNIDAFLAE
jgi:hypothetical protein